MTDQQILAISITVLAILAGAVFSNSRIGDLHKRIADVRDVIRAEFHKDIAEMNLRMEIRFNSIEGRFNNIDRKLDEILRIVGDHETRIASLERP